MTIRGIHHLSMKCDSRETYARARDFYCGLLGMKPTLEWDTGMMLDTGRGLLELFCNGKGEEGMGAIRHLALETDDAAACAEKVREAGFEVFLEPKEITVPCHAVIAFCYGPFGEQVEFFQPLA